MSIAIKWTDAFLKDASQAPEKLVFLQCSEVQLRRDGVTFVQIFLIIHKITEQNLSKSVSDI